MNNFHNSNNFHNTMPKNEKNLIHRMDTSDDWTSVATENACYALEAFDSLPEHLPRFDWDDFQKVSLLGKGATSQVWMVIDNKTKREYALKCLAPDALHTSDEFVGAATDLGMETNMLDKLQHPNIVQLRGICRTSLSESFVDAGKGYFLLTNVLEETLKDRIVRWGNDSSSSSRSWFSYARRSFHKKTVSQLYNRIETVVLGVAKAMNHIHSQEIVLRDLKAENIGFDQNANVRLFDFGFARSLDDCGSGEESYGTLRYMAPEVMRGESCGLYSDVYSFGILLWEIATAQTPFGSLNPKDSRWFVHLVSQKGIRPPIHKVVCPIVRQLIQDCWHADYTQRPSFEQILERLQAILVAEEGKVGEEKLVTSCLDDSEVLTTSTPLSVAADSWIELDAVQ